MQTLRPTIKPTHRAIALPIVIAIALQLPIFVGLERIVNSGPSAHVERPNETMEVELYPTKDRKKKKDKKNPDGQYVTITPPKDKTPPKKSKYIAQFNSSAKKEMKRKRRFVRKPKLGGKAAVSTKGNTKPRRMARRGSRPKVRARTVKPKQVAMAPTHVRSPLSAVTRDEIPRKPTKAETKKTVKPGLVLPAMNIDSMVQNHRRLLASLPADDVIQNVPEGPEDRLNAKETKHWYFFERIKKRVRARWRPAEIYRQRDPKGHIHGIKDRYTVLFVTLNKKGEVITIKLMKQSGIKFLDREARRAFKAAAPFPNPSPGLANARGYITFKFGFLFEISSSRFRTFWKRI